jgi:hypothetical protein
MQWRSLAMTAVLVLGLAASGSCETPGYDLCIEQSPARAGRITPDSGTHRFSPNAVVTLSADPQPGYQFAYWLGDVADPAARRTTVRVNSPKVIVAVFQPAEENLVERKLLGGGGGPLLSTARDFGTPGWSIPGGRRTISPEIPNIHIPEPATAILLTFGAMLLRSRRHGKKERREPGAFPRLPI